MEDRKALCERIMTASPEEFNSVNHAASELALLSAGVDDDDMQEMMNKNLLELVLVFATQGHSGFSASYAVNALNKLLRFEPLTPLTGADDEWTDLGGGRFQNKRFGAVFKEVERFGGQAYNIEAVVFREPSGACYTSRDSAQPVTFPYTPKREYKDVPE